MYVRLHVGQRFIAAQLIGKLRVLSSVIRKLCASVPRWLVDHEGRKDTEDSEKAQEVIRIPQRPQNFVPAG